MKRIYARYFLLLILFLGLEITISFSQPGVGISFNFSKVGGITVPAGLTNQIVPAANQDDFAYRIAPAGLNIKFAGVAYTNIVVSTNGWMALIPAGTPAGIPASLSAGLYLSANQLSNNTSGFPILAPYWDDLASTIISYSYVAPVLTVQWTCKINKTAPSGATNFWLKMDATTGVISYSYANNPAYVLGGPPSASIGLAGICTGDYYSYDNVSAFADSTIETSNIATKPVNFQYIFTPYQLYDNCVNAFDLSPLTSTCTPSTFNINNALTSGSVICATTDVADVWFKITKPIGVSNLKVTTSSASPGCQSVAGTSVEVFSSCGGVSLGCSTTSVANPGFGEVILSRPPCNSETLFIRVTNDGDIGGKFNICVNDVGAPTGIGKTCGSPNWICNLPYNYSGTTAGFGAEYDSANSACHDPFMNGEDYVFAYTPTSNICLRISINSTGLNPGVFVFDGCPDLLLTTHCIASAVNSVGNATINSVSLIAGNTYYFLVDNDTLSAAPFNIPFDINITSVGTSQAYDACGATYLGNIPFNQTCTYTTYTTECATPSVINYTSPGCGNFTNNITGDIWLSFTPTYTGNLLINTKPGATNPSSDVAMAIYTGNCASLNLVACDDNSAGNNMPGLSIPVTNGTTCYIRLWTVAPGNTGNFSLCFTGDCAPPNDLPCAAVLVNLGTSISGTNVCAGSASEPINPAQCVAGGLINTVWYKAVVPASGSLKIRTHTRSLSDTQIEAFRFLTGCANAASSFVRIACNDDGTDCGASQGAQSYHDFSELSISGQLVGDTIYIAVDGYNSQTGTFDITVIDGTATSFPPIAGADCDGAYDVCGSTSITVNDPGVLSYGNICDFANNYDCWLNGERNSAWYRFSVNPGTLQFDIQSTSDYDFVLWDITGVSNPCALIQAHSLASSRCSWVTTITGHTGISVAHPTIDWEAALTVVGTRTFLLMIDNWNPPFSTTGYTIDWMGSPISTTASSVVWQGATDTLFSTPNNWGVAPCIALPNCSIDAVVSTTVSGRQPTINSNQSVRNLTINPGAVLRIKSPFTLDVCGNFTNNGTLIAEPGSTVRFIGPINQTISGMLTGANSFANLTIDKLAGSGGVTLNSNIDVVQNFLTNTGNSVFNINGKYMKVGGNFTNNNGTITFTGTGYSTVEFYKSINQNFTNLNGSISLNRVVMNKPAGKLYLSGVNSNMNIDSMLTLTSGIIVTRSLASLEVNMKYYLPAALLGPPSALSFIDGKLRRKISNGAFSTPPIPASYDFPVGDSLSPGGYELANITFNSATLVTDLLATFSPWPSGPPLQGPFASECIIATYSNKPIFDNGFWTFTRSSVNVSGRYNVSLYNTGFTNNTGSGWTVAKASLLSDPALPASWNLTGNCVITSTPANTQRTNFNPNPGTDSLSFNHRYATAQTEMTLPVELLFFTAEPHGEDVICNWETASEINNDYFDVERSDDGKEYVAIGRIQGFGNGTSTELRKYSFVDHEPCEDVRYYRLKQVDVDGESSYSDPAAVNCKLDKDLVTVYPNPSKSSIFCSFYQTKNGAVKIQWLDVPGKIIKEEIHEVVKGYNTIHSDVSDLSDGIYYLRIREVGLDFTETDRQIKFLKN